LAVGDSCKGDQHFVVYDPPTSGKNKDAALRKLKSFRDLHVQNLVSSLRLKYYVCSDEALAKKLKIDTNRPGDLYLLR
jgi:hypothetical protein